MSLNENTAVVSTSGPAATAKKFGFPRCYRLTKTDEYSSVFGFRRAVKSTHFLLHYRPRVAEAEETVQCLTARLGVVVPKRLVKAAVRRNLIKRLCREQFRLLLQQLPQRDLILRLAVKPGMLDRKAIAEEIRTLLLKLKASGR